MSWVVYAWLSAAAGEPDRQMSLPLTVVLAATFLGESVGWRLGVGVALMTIGAMLTIG
ncbi:MAG TPA: hypothetical protein VG871_00365 [Vicinamibacterales bacterium]|nr:hypothetical protein [Vicinamibacterales bacterium]